ncbi:MAG: hypothetical protein JHC41_05295, partial [Nitrosopumilus sp.]|nr:hypothetical protein [Nitrosopumilus sp.]
MKISKTPFLLTTIILGTIMIMSVSSADNVYAAPGSVWSTTANCEQDANVQYTSFDDIYVTAAGLAPNKDHFVKITSTSGADPITDATNPIKTDGTGAIVCLKYLHVPATPLVDHGTIVVTTASGVYKLWISETTDFASSKTDNLHLAIIPASPPTIVTSATPKLTPNLPISPVSDLATLTGSNGIVNGTVEFRLVNSTSNIPFAGPVTIPLDGGIANSGSLGPSSALKAGVQYCWNIAYTSTNLDKYSSAVYNGTSSPTTECFTPQTIPPTINTSATPKGDKTLPISLVSDSVKVNGTSGAATGTVTFTLVNSTGSVYAGPTSPIALNGTGGAASGSLGPSS